MELLKIDDDLAREFYQNQAIKENWTVRELKRQKKTGLFHRLALSKNKEKILELSRKGQIITRINFISGVIYPNIKNNIKCEKMKYAQFNINIEKIINFVFFIKRMKKNTFLSLIWQNLKLDDRVFVDYKKKLK